MAMKAGEVTQQVKGLSNDSSLIPGPHMIKERTPTKVAL